MKTRQETLEEKLLAGGFITPADLEKIKSLGLATGESLVSLLAREKIIGPDTLATIFSFWLGMPIIDLEHFQVQRDLLPLIPGAFSQVINVLPVSVEGDTLTVVLADPTDEGVLDSLAQFTGKRIKSAVALQGREGMNKKIKEVYH